MKDLLKKKAEQFKKGELSEKEFLNFIEHIPYHSLGDIKLDFHRPFRRGLPEVIYGSGKDIGQLRIIIRKFQELQHQIIITRMDEKRARRLVKDFPDLTYHAQGKILTFRTGPEIRFAFPILVLSGGASDEPVAEEAFVIARYLGNRVEKEYDVGVACISRILDLQPRLNDCAAIIVAAGMEGALPSVVAGMTSTPVIAVPTSVGYGANFSGLAPLLAMLNSCAGGIAVVNIDNGFGAAFLATLFNQKLSALLEKK